MRLFLFLFIFEFNFLYSIITPWEIEKSADTASQNSFKLIKIKNCRDLILRSKNWSIPFYFRYKNKHIMWFSVDKINIKKNTTDTSIDLDTSQWSLNKSEWLSTARNSKCVTFLDLNKKMGIVYLKIPPQMQTGGHFYIDESMQVSFDYVDFFVKEVPTVHNDTSESRPSATGDDLKDSDHRTADENEEQTRLLE